MGTIREQIMTQVELLDRGSDGHLSRGFERYIPLRLLDGLEPVPSNNESDDGEYHPGKPIVQPIEVQYSACDDLYMVYAGNHRIAQARANGQSHIIAFVEPDPTSSKRDIGKSATMLNPDREMELEKKPASKRRHAP